MAKIPQTPRRSKRGQLIAIPSQEANDLYRAWCGKLLYTRPINTNLDFDRDDIEFQKDDLDHDEEDEELETAFYSAMQMQKRTTTTYKGVSREAEEETTIYNIGDTVLVDTDGDSSVHKRPSIAVIIAMWEVRKKGRREASDPTKMRVRLQWFLRPTQLPPYGLKREHTKVNFTLDRLCFNLLNMTSQNEIYYKIGGRATERPQTILGHCNVTSKPPAAVDSGGAQTPRKRRPTGWVYEGDDADRNTHDFYCRFAYRGEGDHKGFYSVDWEKHHSLANLSTTTPPSEIDLQWGSGFMWEVEISPEKTGSSRDHRSNKRAKVEAIESGSENGDATDDNYEAQSHDEADDSEESNGSNEDEIVSNIPRTPSKKRKWGLSQSQSPSKRKAAFAATPKKPAKRTVVHPTPHSKAALRKRAKANGASDKFAIRPQTLDFAGQDLSHLPEDPWLRSMHVLHVGSRPDALPCREEEFERVLRCVGELLEEGSGGCVYISGVPGTGKTATVHAVVRQLKRMAENSETNPFTYVEINGLKIPEPSAAYNVLWEGLSGQDVGRISSKESLKALTRYFSGGIRGPESHACVVLMDELDQLVTAKQDVVYNFFNWPTLAASRLVVIAVANTMDLPERVMTGRVRSRLGMTRINFSPYSATQLQHIVQARLKSVKDGLDDDSQEALSSDAIKLAAMKVSGISGDARRVLDICRRTVELVHPERRTARPPDVKEVIRVMQNSPTAAYLRECSFHERMMLASLIKCIKREGVQEIKWGEVQHQHLIYMNVLTSPSDPTRKPTPAELSLVLDSLVASRAMLIEDGPAVLRKPEGDRLVMLNLESSEVERVLGEVGGTNWKNVLNT
ncbi:hypothetical protein C0995_014586 [Termitomyces sp. Mi166|nr:hypothetical protein C0995_014586 [Termitomyces sp. Mi166\